jgi:hypothetical protein
MHIQNARDRILFIIKTPYELKPMNFHEEWEDEEEATETETRSVVYTVLALVGTALLLVSILFIYL